MNQSLDPTALVYESIYGYCRVSSMEQANHGTSLAEQKKIITKMSMYLFDRSEERRVGKEGRSRGAPYH